ncbi:MAG: ATP-dependent protease subunit HslV [Phycisphaerales bacterium]|nr:ATP-dependent protease subunit HslV [Phycisphaerales bacterium]
MDTHRATTILSVRRGESVAIAGDGQVTLGNIVAKPDAVKIRRLDEVGSGRRGVLVGFAGAAADAFALMEQFEKHLKESPTNLRRASIELARLWRTDRALRRLDSMMIVADLEATLMVSGQGDVIEPTDGVCAIGSGGSYALAAARALVEHTELGPEEVCASSMAIAAGLCIYTNDSITSLSLS